jgi:hypothetical protein
VMQGVKRLPDISTLNHRPKKKPSTGGLVGVHPPPAPLQQHQQQQKQQQQQQPLSKQLKSSQQLQPSATSQTTPSSNLPTPDIRLSSAWQELVARNAEMEQRLNAMSTASASLVETLTRNLDAVTVQLENQQRAFTSSLEQITTQLGAQAAINDYFRVTIENIAQRLGLPPAAGPSATLPYQAGPATTATPAQLAQHPMIRPLHAAVGPQQLSLSLSPTPTHIIAAAATSAATTSTFSLTSEDSAPANPARNGSVARHG